jgi:hypothetical protein
MFDIYGILSSVSHFLTARFEGIFIYVFAQWNEYGDVLSANESVCDLILFIHCSRLDSFRSRGRMHWKN